ncbi:DUF397 domain-containing protein [Streptomyces coffeae]|uniref:DUF397 domain-containing protein n=1 Tax=Streptomyces coffeae TaxID=621382 RepID=A0ABS1N6W5_9ACTN|nr:DUF397 domain-containing protein [Streptomyces coffeae]MBL1095700.1 DUF397 domain-containing protein [Streptomyces coffeae]
MSTEDSARLAWFKSSYSGNEGGECVEVATTPDAVHVRDSKEPMRPQLVFTQQSWATFVAFATRP